jgi:hypothetical protein
MMLHLFREQIDPVSSVTQPPQLNYSNLFKILIKFGGHNQDFKQRLTIASLKDLLSMVFFFREL